MTSRSTRLLRAVALAAIACAALATTPADGHARDCAGDYVACLDAAGVIGSSDALHERDCYGEYWRCVSSRFLSF